MWRRCRLRLEALLVVCEDIRHFSAVKEFEKHYGTQGLSVPYFYPRDVSAKTFQFRAFLGFLPALNIYNNEEGTPISEKIKCWLSQKLGDANRINDSLVAFNRGLASVRRTPDDLAAEIHFMFGVALSIPPRDIEYFLNVHRMLDRKTQTEYGAKVTAAAEVLGAATGVAPQYQGTIGWIPSPETLQLIHEIANQRQPAREMELQHRAKGLEPRF